MITGWHHGKSKEQLIEAAKVYGPMRHKLGLKVKEILDNWDLSKSLWFLDAGTLLGAWRNGKMIPHDDDFDLGVYVSNKVIDEMYEGSKAKLLESMCKKFKDNGFEARVVTSYVDKIEIYESEHGKFWLNEEHGIDFHNVTVDLTLFYDHPTKKNCLQNSHMNSKHTCFPIDEMFPTGELTYEGMVLPAPADPEKSLTMMYGYLGPNAIWNPETKLYEKAK
eukprot:CAMPEP_0114586150 /NCGR_PEP_ID=MMETSP0125-20121206/9456_1 /TAXON_ID=485358 ORGANISM="Aristerostoma sp., Strain ATCC 50986" /NCGR_SAMPLE_ID=MMETSP0125 /ASSEMBLY_ACC=CAM_ASM_000245 /LENGTH=220 /DNA_ID=CAMNT_0001781465 /DNA_START=49 /DNA_END=711 /DNA_ORIENTATION=+